MDSGSDPAAEFARDIRAGLCNNHKKQLHPKYLYDAVGTALFDVITLLPEYGLTRADSRLLERCAPTLPDLVGTSGAVVAELGSGGGSKTRTVLAAFPRERIAYYSPIDVSEEALHQCQATLGDLVEVRSVRASYIGGIKTVCDARPDGLPILLLFLGGSIGNLDPPDRKSFLAELRSRLRAGDCVLIGFDLVKPVDTLLKAYDDPAGVTAAFNRNVLARINRELGAAFDPTLFRHEARYDERYQRIEMHLRSERDQQVGVPGCDGLCDLKDGETIWTESSYKFEPEQVRRTMDEAGFHPLGEWIDDEWPLLEGLWTVRD